ncbi:HECT-like ubiquitin-conjugating enzyme-binding-domain-containing protein [Syncephalastrum racemosum]|uniref:HECT-like ubiquitin-conjugating enzyme-binding-domain-containing protein n=1 Tax=Syncephalastrum racemosum TaxID=13706 RepID=A0A1X2H8H5_SYNRA|nr:HECT-like ubiquitin-conjugating enzyme-binding-domain-containing protein [Syncephalastrum racemosum]
MAVPFFAEHLANIQSIRATLCSAPDYPVPEKLRIVNQTLTLGSVSVVPFESVGIRVEPTVVGLTHHDTCLWDFKLTTRQSLQTQGDLPAVWSARDLKDTKQIVCRACQQSLAEAPVFQSKDLPSEHWYELVECWICHETKPEEHRARMQPIGARQDMILVGTTYLLLHPDNTKHLQVDEARLRNVNWDQGLQTRWLPVHCQQCGADIGEGQYKRDENGTPALLASKLYKYAVSIPSQTSCPVFMDFLTHDLVSAAKAHATYRFLIQGRKDNKTYALMWLFNWDTNIIYNHGFQDGGSAVHHKRGKDRNAKRGRS